MDSFLLFCLEHSLWASQSLLSSYTGSVWCGLGLPGAVVASTQNSQCSGPLLLLPSCWQVCLPVFSSLGLCCYFLLLAPPSGVFPLGKGIASPRRNGFNSLEEAGDQSPLYMLEYIYETYVYLCKCCKF